MARGSCAARHPALLGPTVAANRFLTGLTNVLYGSRLTDMETCYKVMRTEVARGLELEANRFDIEPEITAKLLRAGHSHRRTAGSLRASKPGPGEEDRLARRRQRRSWCSPEQRVVR